MLTSHDFLGVRVDNVSMDQTAQGIARAIKNKQPFNIVTVNPELVMAATKNKEFKDIIANADIVTPDGVGLIIMGWLTRRKLKQRVTGVDLCDRLAKEAAKQGWSIYLLGAQPGIAQLAADKLTATHPGLKIAGVSSGDPDAASASDIILDITTTKPDIILVAYGSPTQELWIQNYRKSFDPLITIGVGGSFDFIAGSTKRAPKWVQDVGLEWLWRLTLQPKRLRRMLALPKFAILSLFK